MAGLDLTKPCSKCGGERDRKNAYCSRCMSVYGHDHYLKRNDARLKKTYGISMEQYQVLLVKQGGKCGICKRPERLGQALSVDHDHKTGRVRGLLCRKCNRSLGGFDDDPVRLEAALRYLQ